MTRRQTRVHRPSCDLGRLSPRSMAQTGLAASPRHRNVRCPSARHAGQLAEEAGSNAQFTLRSEITTAPTWRHKTKLSTTITRGMAFCGTAARAEADAARYGGKRARPAGRPAAWAPGLIIPAPPGTSARQAAPCGADRAPAVREAARGGATADSPGPDRPADVRTDGRRPRGHRPAPPPPFGADDRAPSPSAVRTPDTAPPHPASGPGPPRRHRRPPRPRRPTPKAPNTRSIQGSSHPPQEREQVRLLDVTTDHAPKPLF